MDKERLKKYKLFNGPDGCDMTKFNYLNKSGVYTWPTIDDKEFYDDVMNSWNTLGFSKEE